MNFKKRFIALCLLLSLSILAPETAMLNTVTDATNITATVQAKTKKKVTSKKKTVKKAKTAKKKTVKAKKEVTVYVTATGECYHTHACGRGNFYKSTLSSAKASGLRPCKKCY